MEMSELLEKFAAQKGVAGGFAPDEEGVVRIDVGSCTVCFREVSELYGMLVYGVLGALPAYGADELKTELLSANFMGRATAGGTLSLSEDGFVYYHRFYDLRMIDLDGFMELFTDCAQTMLEWKGLIDAYAPAAEPQAADQAAGQTDVTGPANFIRV